MTVAPVVTETTYALGGGSSLGPFATVFPYAQDADVTAWLDNANGAGPQQLTGGQYVLNDVVPTLSSGGNVTLSSSVRPVSGSWSTNSFLTLRRSTSRAQPTSFPSGQALASANIEAALDNIERQLQELAQAFTRALTSPLGEAGLVLPPAPIRNGYAFFGVGGALTTIAPSPAGLVGAPQLIPVTGSGALAAGFAYMGDSSGGAFTLNPPSLASAGANACILVFAGGSAGLNPVTFTAQGADQFSIGGQTTPSFNVDTNGWCALLINYGGAWTVLVLNPGLG